MFVKPNRTYAYLYTMLRNAECSHDEAHRLAREFACDLVVAA